MIGAIGKTRSGCYGMRARCLTPCQSDAGSVCTAEAARGTPGCPQLCSSEDPRAADVDTPRVDDSVSLEAFAVMLEEKWESTQVSAALTFMGLHILLTCGTEDFQRGTLEEACEVITAACDALRGRRLLTEGCTVDDMRRAYVR